MSHNPERIEYIIQAYLTLSGFCHPILSFRRFHLRLFKLKPDGLLQHQLNLYLILFLYVLIYKFRDYFLKPCIFLFLPYLYCNGETITYNFYATILPPFSYTFSLNSDAIRFKSR